MKLLNFLFIFTVLIIGTVIAQVHFPEEDSNVNHQSNQNRNPITSSKCKEGELLYPGDAAGDWVCDCRPAYLYHPKTARCYAAYTQGPCKTKEFLVLKAKSPLPVCELNVCAEGSVPYLRGCYTIPSTKACKQPPNDPTYHTLYVNPSTVKLECGKTSLYSRIGEDLVDEENGTYQTDACFIGGIRAQEGKCKVEKPQ